MPLVDKQVLVPATYYIDGEFVEFTPAHVLSIGKSSQSAVKDGLHIRFPKEHQDYALPFDDPKRKAADVNYNKGKAKNYFLDRSDKSLWVTLDVPDAKFAERLLSGEVPFVSPRIDPSFRAGSGKLYKNLITHIAATCNPIAAEQKPFGSKPGDPIALSVTPAATFLSHQGEAGKPIFFSLADKVVRLRGKWVFVNRPGQPIVAGNKSVEPRSTRLSQTAANNRFSKKKEVSRMRRNNGHAFYMSAGGDSWEYVIEGPAVDMEKEREKWLDNVKTGNKVTIEFEDGGKLVAHVLEHSKAEGDYGGDEGIVKMHFESGDDGWIDRSGSYKGRKISRMTAEPDDVNSEDEEKKKVDVGGTAVKTPTMVAKMSADEEKDKPNFLGGSTEGDESNDDEDEDEFAANLDEDETPNEGAGKKTGKNADFEAAKAELEAHDPPIHLPEDCDAKTGWKMLATALHAINEREKSLDDDSNNDEAMTKATQEPQMVSMSAQIAQDPAVRAMQARLDAAEKRAAKSELKSLEDRFKAVVKTGRMTAERATQYMSVLAKKQMSLGDGSTDINVIKAIARLEAAEELPATDLFDEQTEGYHLSVPEIPNHSEKYSDWGTSPQKEAADTDATVKEMVAMANRRNGVAE